MTKEHSILDRDPNFRIFAEKIDAIIVALQAPLTVDENAAGWSENSKKGYIPFFTKLSEDVRNGRVVSHINMGRSLDGFGIGSGELYEKMLQVTNEINSNLT